MLPRVGRYLTKCMQMLLHYVQSRTVELKECRTSTVQWGPAHIPHENKNLEDRVAPSTGVEKGNREQVIYAVMTARRLLSHVLGQHCHPEQNGSKL